MRSRYFLAAAGALLWLAPSAYAQTPSVPQCAPSAEYTRLSGPLMRIARRIANRQTVTIVAMGSSSTAGVGASTIEHNYPSQLEARLKARFPGIEFRMINRGMSGAVDREMIARFEEDVHAVNPDLVLWQVGTNALLRSEGIDKEGDVMRDGLRRLRAIGADVVLIDPQYAPKVLKDPDAEPMVELIRTIAREEGVPVFRRWAQMKEWREVREIPFEAFLSPDLFHMNDWSYACWAEALSGAIAWAAIQGGTQLAAQPPAATSVVQATATDASVW
jgi:acyl-CoA thioesterase-1